MPASPFQAALLAGAAACAVAVAPAAAAQSTREAELEARLARAEAAISDLRAELQAERAERQATASQVATASQAASDANKKVAALEARPTPPAEGFNVGGTTIKINGFFKAVASVSRYDDGELASGSLGRDFYLPSQIPVGGERDGNDFEGHAKQTRIWLTTATPIGKHMLKGHLEFDFQTSPGTQGSQRTTNGYNLALRRGFLTFDRLLIGQEWSNFQYVAALPETTDFVGPTEGTVFVRQMQARYTLPLSKELSLAVAVENPETASITTTAPAMIENGDDPMPDVTARLTYTAGIGELSLAAILRELASDVAGVGDETMGWGVSAAGKIPFGPDKRHDLRFMASYGEGIGRYLGLNFAPDAVFTGTRLEAVENFAAFAALKLGWTETVRSTFMGGYQKASYPDALLIPGLANRSAWSLAGNIFWSPVKNFDLGLEYRRGQRKVVSGLEGQLDRIEVAAKYSF